MPPTSVRAQGRSLVSADDAGAILHVSHEQIALFVEKEVLRPIDAAGGDTLFDLEDVSRLAARLRGELQN